MKTVTPPRYPLAAVVLLAALIACTGDVTTPSAPTRHLSSIRRLCIEGCEGPDLPIANQTTGFQVFVRNDTLFLPDSTSYYSPGRYAAFEVGPNPDDTTITVATVATADCSNDCVSLTGYGGEDSPTYPNPLVLDSDETYDWVYVDLVTDAPGAGWVSLAAGAGYLQVPVVVYHCTFRSLNSC